MTIRTTTDRSALVDTEYHWRRIDASTPRGVKLQLINETLRVATYGSVATKEIYFTHWAPLPTFKEKSMNTSLHAKHQGERLFVPEPSGWRCELFGCGPSLVLTPKKGEVPNVFWRWMQRICFGNRWIKDERT